MALIDHPIRNTTLTTKCAWPDGTDIQGKENARVERDAFVEVSVEAGGAKTFMHLKGATVAEAEAKAFSFYLRYLACPGHEFEPQTWTNGSGVCKHCKMWAFGVLPLLTFCVVCREPTNWSSFGGDYWCEKHADQRPRYDWELAPGEEPETFTAAEFERALHDVLSGVAAKARGNEGFK